MDFTPLVPCGKHQSVACDLYIATICLPSRVIIRSATSLSIKRVINIDSATDLNAAQLQWSKRDADDGHHRLLVADSKAVLAYDIEDDEWSLQISEGLGGVRHVEWSDTGREILVWAEFQLKMTVWSVVAATGTILPNPKLLAKGFHPRPGSLQAALLQRTSQDIVAIIDTSMAEWQIQKSFPLATTDAQGVRWSPDGKWLAIWDNVVDYKVLIYTPDGRLVRSYTAYETGLGIRTVAWSPTSEYLAIGSYDDKVRLLNTTSFSACIELSHASTIRSDNVGVWRQVLSGQVSRYDAADLPMSPPMLKYTASEALTRSGVTVVSFSPNGYFLATKSERMPTTLWIWSLREFSPVAILVHHHPIKQLQWMPDEAGELIFTCQGTSIAENNALYAWNIDWDEPRIISIPRDGFEVRWFSVIQQAAESGEGSGILIGSADAFTIGYTVPSAEEAEDELPEMSAVQEVTEIDDDHTGEETLRDSRAFDPQGSVIIHELSGSDRREPSLGDTHAML